MRADKSWEVGFHETVNMSSIPGLPTQGSDVTILITKVHLHPLCALVEFWGKFTHERQIDYEGLAKDIQSPGNTFQEFEGIPGDQCLVEIDGTWYRSRIVSRNGLKYSVFLIDKGLTFTTTISKLAWGKKGHFQLPPEVELCVLANVLPLSPENRWSPVALEFLKSLAGKSVTAHVQEVLVPHRTFILHIPCISKQMYEMGIAKKLSPNTFQDYVLMSLQSPSGAEASPETPKIAVAAGERLHKQQLYLYPELQTGTVETVVVTDVTNPQRIFCQLKVFSQELKKLSEQITQCCEGRMANCIVTPEMIGFPCAARGSDGRWYRSVLQQVFPTNKMVEVLNVDYGTKQFVKVENVRPLAAEFFRMPVVTYVCSLHGTIDKGVGWTTSQIDYLRTLLLYKTVIAKFEYQSISEGVHYVTLYGDENKNINKLFDAQENCSLDCEKTLGDYAIRSTAYNHQQLGHQRKTLPHGQAVEETEGKGGMGKLPAEELTLNSSHMATIQHVTDPSEFWIQTHNYARELDELMDNIYQLYNDSGSEDVVRKPTVGLYCAAKAEDGDFYRATVAEVGEMQVKVFFVDYGNTEQVDRSNIRNLPVEFKKLPCLSLKCTLAGIGPKDGKWSQSASEFFIKTVKDKELNVHVVAKYGEGYVVQLTDPIAQGDGDLSSLMCNSGFAERAETKRQPKARMTAQPAFLPPTQLANPRLASLHVNKGMPCQTKDTVVPASTERIIPTFKEHMFPIGSVLDVTVSYIESPNDFWCQLVQNAGHLKLLMHDMQAFYAGSEFQPLLGTACVARHPDNKMWYRALVIHKHETLHVDVLFVDYGQMETVSLYDLRRICPQFLTLHGQAFRCSLLNPVDPTSATNEWNEEATAKFHKFVETASSNFVVLKCTIYAVMYSEQRIVFNIVDLETPFESISTSMVSVTESSPPKKAAAPAFRLDTYYYSTHNVKTGTEERVTVSCVNNVGKFYCHLDRNADVIKDLRVKVRNLCHQLENVKLPTVFGTLCFAKYTDGQWYRGQIKATKPAILVHFVDYGDTIEVQKSDMLPVPREANDIMTVPVQAVVCSLSDFPAKVFSEVNSWFEKNVTDGKFRALVVAREPDGKLLVELYHGNTQINSKIKKMFQIEMHTEEQILNHGYRASEANHAQRTLKPAPKEAEEWRDHTQTVKKTFFSAKPAHNMMDGDKNLQSVPKPFHQVCENGEKAKAAPLELYRHPHQRQSIQRTLSKADNESEPEAVFVKPRTESIPTENKQLIKSKPPGAESQKKNHEDKLPTLANLPSKSLSLGMEEDVYISHCDGPLSFYVQLLRDENEIFSLAEKLNDPLSNPQTDDIKELRPGDFVQAEFEEDSSWYRALVREIHGSTTALVEFVDFGNTATVPVSKIARLHKSFLQLPLYSTHCMLSEAAALGEENALDPEVVSAFKGDIGGNGEKALKCRFIRQLGSAWEVSLEDDGGVQVTCKAATTRCAASEKLERVEEQPAQNSNIKQTVPKGSPSHSCPLSYHQQEFLEGQMLEVYIATTNDAQSFWCQSADSEELDKITSSLEVGDVDDLKQVDPSSLSTGSPCIALFSDDHLWYRAEVIEKNGDELSVQFVDYGNKSRVKVVDVREITPDLIATPPQAFLCELEGFDASHGSWDRGAVDQLSALTTDKALQLKITRVTKEEGKMKCLVLMECDGQVINEEMKNWWKSFATANEPSAVGPTPVYETPIQCDSHGKEIAQPTEKSSEMDNAVARVQPQRYHSVEQITGELQDSLQSPEKQMDQTLSECFKTAGSPMLSSTESLTDTEEEVNTAPTMAASQTTVSVMMETDEGTEEGDSPSDEDPAEAIDESLIATTDLESTPAEINTDNMEDATVSGSPLDKNPTEAIDESAIRTTDLVSPPAEVNTDNLESTMISDPTEKRDDRKVTIAIEHYLANTTTVKMVPREAVHPEESGFEQIETELVPSSCPPTTDVPTKPEREVVDVAPKEEALCVTTHVEGDLLTETETSTRHEEICSALLSDTNTAASEPHTCTAPVQRSDDEAEEVTCAVKEARLTDVCTEPNEAGGDKVTSARDDCPSGMAAEETIQTELLPSSYDVPTTDVPTEQDIDSADVPKEEPCVTTNVEVQDESLPPSSELPCEHLTEASSEHIVPIEDVPLPDEDTQSENNSSTEDTETCVLDKDEPSALPPDTEPEGHTVASLLLNEMLEEVTCLIGNVRLTEVCAEPEQEAEKEDSEQLCVTPQQTEDSSDDVLEDETSSSADESFEAQWSKITHLSLLISEGSASPLPAEQQTEE